MQEKLPANAPFQIPYQSLIPETVDGLIAAEKSISVSHIVNGCTRLQPVVMLIGQAAGAAAALSVKQNVDPRNLDVHKLQKVLLDAGCQLFPYKDLWNHHADFSTVQYLALNGVFVDSDEFTFGPDVIISEEEAKQLVQNLKLKIDFKELTGLKRSEAYLKIFKLTF